MALRPIEIADAARVHGWASQARACAFQTWGPNSREETDAFVEAAVRSWQAADPSTRLWSAVAPGDVVVGIGEVTTRSRWCSEIGYAVHVDHWGRGLGTAIARLLLHEAFRDPAVERVQATCDPRNAASATVLKRTGMVEEGTLRHTLRLQDGWRDSVMHSILRSEWTDASGSVAL